MVTKVNMLMQRADWPCTGPTCLIFMAADNPAGPAPTMSTSNSMLSLAALIARWPRGSSPGEIDLAAIRNPSNPPAILDSAAHRSVGTTTRELLQLQTLEYFRCIGANDGRRASLASLFCPSDESKLE
jgi:hypothetical protein